MSQVVMAKEVQEDQVVLVVDLILIQLILMKTTQMLMVIDKQELTPIGILIQVE